MTEERERRSGFTFIVELPGDGPWRMCVFGDQVILADESCEHPPMVVVGNTAFPLVPQ